MFPVHHATGQPVRVALCSRSNGPLQHQHNGDPGAPGPDTGPLYNIRLLDSGMLFRVHTAHSDRMCYVYCTLSVIQPSAKHNNELQSVKYTVELRGTAELVIILCGFISIVNPFCITVTRYGC